MQQSIASKPQRSFRLGWILAAAAAAILVVGALTSIYVGSRSGKDHVFSEIADLHVATLASSSPVDDLYGSAHGEALVPGKDPFRVQFAGLQNSEFSLLGGRMAYLHQTPGAQIIYDVRKHHLSVFIFPERSLRAGLDENSLSPEETAVQHGNMPSQGGLRYFVIGDASAADIDSLAKLFKAAS